MASNVRAATAAILIVSLFALGAGCAPPVSEGGFNAPDPASKLYAIIRAGRERDQSAVPDLIEQLDSDDQAVRFYAIGALHRITGTRLGFVPYAPEHERDAAIARWTDAYRNGRLVSAEPEKTSLGAAGHDPTD